MFNLNLQFRKHLLYISKIVPEFVTQNITSNLSIGSDLTKYNLFSNKPKFKKINGNTHIKGIESSIFNLWHTQIRNVYTFLCLSV